MNWLQNEAPKCSVPAEGFLLPKQSRVESVAGLLERGPATWCQALVKSFLYSITHTSLLPLVYDPEKHKGSIWSTCWNKDARIWRFLECQESLGVTKAAEGDHSALSRFLVLVFYGSTPKWVWESSSGVFIRAIRASQWRVLARKCPGKLLPNFLDCFALAGKIKHGETSSAK